MTDLRTTIGGIGLEHPILLASGPLSWNADAILRATRAGAAAVVTKTIRRAAAENPVPHIAWTKDGILNAERWSDLDAAAWIEREIPRAKAGGATVIASLGLTSADVVDLAEGIEVAGADALEIVTYDEDQLPKMVEAAVSRVRIPVFAKISANWRDPASVAEICCRLGARAITAIDSVGPALRIDLETRRAILGAPSGWWSGAAIFPLALRVVAEVADRVEIPVIGTGGVTHPDRAVEMLFAGASAVGICSHALTDGLAVFERLRDGTARRLADLGIRSIAEAVGAAVNVGGEARGAVSFALDSERCTACRLCVERCPYEARLDPATTLLACRYCGLCASVCPTGALSLEGGAS